MYISHAITDYVDRMALISKIYVYPCTNTNLYNPKYFIQYIDDTIKRSTVLLLWLISSIASRVWTIFRTIGRSTGRNYMKTKEERLNDTCMKIRMNQPTESEENIVSYIVS